VILPFQVDAALSEAVDQQLGYATGGLMAVSSEAHWPGYDVSLHPVLFC